MTSTRLRTCGTFLVGMATGMIFIHSLSYIDVASKSPATNALSFSRDIPPNATVTHDGSPVTHDGSPVTQDDSRSGDEQLKDTLQWSDGEDESHKRQDNSVAVDLTKRVRVLCWILTSPKNLVARSIHVNATWGQRCTTLLFMSSRASVRVRKTELPVVELDVPEGHDALWAKTKAALSYIHDHHVNDTDWIFKGDDDTFTVMENLRYLLKDHSPDDPKYFGRRFKSPYSSKQSYMSGGAGYVLSREALRRLATLGLPNPKHCATGDVGYEDLLLGLCLEKSGVEFVDTRDRLGRQRFQPLNPRMHLTKGSIAKNHWLWGYEFYPSQNGPDCCSDYSITFHYVSANDMYVMEYLIYHMKPYGIAIDYDQREIHRRTKEQQQRQIRRLEPSPSE